MEPLKIALLGYGKMGKEVEKIALKRQHQIIAIIDNDNDWDNQNEALQLADVAIEFSLQESAPKNILRCFEKDIPIIVGTTGWLDNFEKIKNICLENNKSMLYASNFSIGVNILFEINKHLAKLMNNYEEYEVWMEEIHHIQKLDAPSGTAITLANDIIQNITRKGKWKNDMDISEDELYIRSVREAELPGTHSISYESDADVIEIKHSAKNRKGFSLGAVIAAEWIYGKKGFFNMKDVLKIS